MDRERLGRVLGTGARHAARTLIGAAEAAVAPDPKQAAAPAPPRPDAMRSAASVIRSAPSATQVRTQAGRAGKGFFRPLATFSSVLWLEVTGAFFAIFAAFAGSGAWKLRGVLGSSSAPATQDVHRFWLYSAVAAVFAYFAVSSFVRAARRQKQ